VIACLPNIIISSVSIPVTILLSVLLYHSIDYASLAQNHYYLLAAVTMPARALVFWFVSVRIRHMKMILKDRQYIIFLILLVITNLMFTSLSVLIFSDTFSGVDISVTAVCIAVMLILFFIIATELSGQNQKEDRQSLEIAMLENQISSNQKTLSVQEDLYKLRHDLKHFINTFSNEDSDDPEIRRIINDYKDRYEKTVIPYNSPSQAVNYVLTIKKQEAAERGIDFDSTLNIPCSIPMEDADLYLLLSNLLDNAIQHIGIRRKISVEIISIEDRLSIRVINSADIKVLDNDNNIKYRPSEKHGYGIMTVRTLLSKYGGTLYLDQDDENFAALAYIPLNNGQLIQEE
jgi:signal transduction histidine kinase